MAEQATAIRPHPSPDYSTQGSQYEHLPRTPLRGIILGPSGSGKTVCMVDMILRLYRGAWARLYVFSPSVDIDMTWKPVKEYSEQVLGVNPDKERCFYSEWDPGALQAIVDQQAKITQLAKTHKMTQLPGILIVVDDFADDPRIMHASGGASAGGSMLNTLFIRGRHMMISTLVSSQKLRLISPTIRVNVQFMLVWRLRNAQELSSLLEELSAIHPIPILKQMYERATEERFSFWFINFLPPSAQKEDMFWLRFDGGRMVLRRAVPLDARVGV